MNISSFRLVSTMKKLILGLALIFLLACTAPSMAQTSTTIPNSPQLHLDDVFVDQVELILDMQKAFPLADVQIYHKACGEENSYYYQASEGNPAKIVLCSEMDAYPDVALMFAAHEMGHAISDAYADIMDEQSADEIGALAMIAFGHTEELYMSSFYYIQDPIQGHRKDDPHPANSFRAWFLSCMAQGAEGVGGEECVELFKAEDMKWALRLSEPIVVPEISIEDLWDLLRHPFGK